ncbi:hypothetical protein ACTHGU_08050 [Chitinophagaceae bacterium MMS25-I14]
MNKLRIAVASLLLWIGFAGNVAAQEVIYSPYEKFDLRSGDFSVVGKVSGRLYTYRASSDGYMMDVYNDSMERTATVILDFFPNKIYETKFIAYSDRILVLYQAIESGKVVQYAALLDDKGRLLKKPISLSSAKTGFFGPTRDYFSSAISDDKRQIFVYSANDKGDDMNMDGTLIDDQMNIVRRVHTSYKADNNVEHGEVLIANNGTIYVPVYTPVGSKNYADQVWVLAADSGNHFTPVSFPLNDHYATKPFLRVDNNNNRVYIGGFYADKKNGSRDGVLFGYYDMASGSIQNHKMIAFDPELRMATGDRNQKRAFDDYQVRQLIVKNDGGFVLLSEDYYMLTRNSAYTPGWGYYSMYYYGPYSMPSVREYHYNDIMALSYNGEGTREWQAFVRKEQYSQEDGGMFSSYALLNTGGALGFLFNDYNSNKSRIQLATIDGDGKVNMRSMAAGSKDDPDWLPRSGKQVGSREIIIPCLRKKQICFAKIVF